MSFAPRTRLDQLKSLFTQIQQEIEYLSARGDLASKGVWIVRYQARGRGWAYWYYKWQSHEAIFATKHGKKSCHRYIGKAGSPAYLKAVEIAGASDKNRRVTTSASYARTGIVRFSGRSD